jgi:2-oxoisovalerate dehydrogenase E2 component (dihydrolipoyl transacylase)
MSEFCLPDLGEGLQEAEIVAWQVAEGDHVVVDQPLVSVETEKAVVEIPSPKAGHVARLRARPGDRVKVGAPLLSFEEGPHAETGTVVGELARPIARPAADPEAAAGPQGVRAAPAVRARARSLGIDLANVTPSGPGGAILLADIEAASSRVPVKILSGARRAMALNMARAGREIVPASLHDEADVEGWGLQEDVTLRLVRAIVAGCQAEPVLNASFDAATLSMRANSTIDLGIAIDSRDGLFVPVLRDVANSNPPDWRRQIDAAKVGVKERTLSPAELRNPTITLSNFGTIAGQHAGLVIMPPQVAIVGAGRISARAVGTDAGLALRRMLPLSITFDHRAVTGGEAARFLLAIITDLRKSV